MNVTYDQFNTQDVAKILEVTPQTVASWVRKGHIKATNVSDGTERGRYMFDDDEITRVQKLMREHGKFAWMNHGEIAKPIALPVLQLNANQLAKEPEPARAVQFNADRVMNKILKIQDLKQELEDINARRNQLINEIEALKKEVMEDI